jgi:hypothetical protein
MAKHKKEPAKITEREFLLEHILEVRHAVSGEFLDLRGHIADYVREEGFLPHWQIDTNIVNFRDGSKKVESEGAFIGFRSAGHFLLNAVTRNHFQDRAAAFWKLAMSIPSYNLPQLQRFGARTKIFVPSALTFEELNDRVYQRFFTDRLRSAMGGTETDLQFTIEAKEGGFDARVVCGPLHKDEGKKHFQFEAPEFGKCGLYVDLDYYRTTNLSHTDVPKLLHEAMIATWRRLEGIVSELDL